MQRVAVIGGGIFGTTCALSLSNDTEIKLFERSASLMSGGTYTNQYRHHFGFHYPRSIATVLQCQSSRADFEALWGRAINRSYPAFYAVAKEGSRATPETFLRFCKEQRLSYREAYPPENMLSRDVVSLCLQTEEPIYDYQKLQALAYELLLQKPNVTVNLSSEVVWASFDQSEKKILRIKRDGIVQEESFDAVVNATYANYNALCTWLGLETKELELRLKELILAELPTAVHAAVTIMDGPFATIVPTGEQGIYTVGDAPLSVHAKHRTRGPNPWTDLSSLEHTSRWKEIQERDQRFFPVLRDARKLKSLFAVLPVPIEHIENDDRITGITNHGRGCWSVFEGKIVTAATVANVVAQEVLTFLDHR